MFGESAEESAEKAAQAAQEATQAYVDAKNEIEQNLQSLTTSSDVDVYTTLEEEFAHLTQGVNYLGENISLTAEQYERYRSICEDIIGISPLLARGHNSATEAIGNNADALREVIELEKERQRQNALNYITGDNWDNVVEDSLNQYEKAVEKRNELMVRKGAPQGYKNSDGRQMYWRSGDMFKAFLGYDNGLGAVNLSSTDAQVKDKTQKAIATFKDTLTSLGYTADQIDGIIKEYTYTKSGTKDSYFSYSTWISDNIDFLQDNVHILEGEFAEAVSKYEVALQGVESAQRAMVDTLTEVPMSMKQYGELSDSGQSFIDNWIQSSGMFEIDDKTTADTVLKWKQSIKTMVANLADDTYTYSLGDGTVISAQDIIDSIYSMDPSSVDWSSYQEQMNTLIEYLWTAIGAENNTLGFKDKNALALTFGFDINLQKDNESKMLKRYAEIRSVTGEDAKKYFDSLDAMQVQRLLKLDWNVITNEDELQKALYGDASFNISDYTSSISALQDNISTYQEALENLESGDFTMSDFIELIEKFPDLADGVDVSSKSFNGLSKNLRKAIKASPDNLIDDLEDLREQLVLAGKSTTSIDQLIESIKNLPAEAVKSLTDEYITLADSINEAKKAQTELQEAMNENPNEGFETRGDAMEQMKELMKEGKIGSESELWSIAKAFGFTYDSANTINENADALAEFIAIRQKWYAQDDDGNYTFEGTESFLNAVEKVVQSGGELGKKLQDLGVKWNYDDKTGVLDFDFNNANWDEVVKILGESKELAGLTSEEFYDLLMQVGQFFDIKWQDADDLVWYLQQINKGAESAADNFDASQNAVKSFLNSSDVSTDWINKAIEDLNNDGVIDITVTDDFKRLPEDVQKVLEEYYKLNRNFKEDPFSIKWQLDKDSGSELSKDSIESLSKLTTVLQDNESGTVFIDYTQLEEAAKKAGYTEEAIAAIIEKIKEYNNICGITSSKEDPLGLLGLQADAETTKDYLEVLQFKFQEIKSGDNTISYLVDVQSVVDALWAQGWNATDIQNYLIQLQNSGKFNFNIDGTTIDVNTDDAKGKIGALIAQKETMSEGETTEYNIVGEGESTLDRIISKWEQINDKEFKTNYSVYETKYKSTKKYNPDTGKYEYTASANGTAHVNGTAYKNGSWGAPKTETALMGELGPELV